MPPRKPFRQLALSLAMAAALSACGSDNDDPVLVPEEPAPQVPQPEVPEPEAPQPEVPEPEATPSGLTLRKIGGYSSGQFGVSAAEIPAFDAASKRLFVVNALAGSVDVLDLVDPSNPVKAGSIDASQVLFGAEINSVAVHGGIVAVAIQAPVKTDDGYVATYDAATLRLLGSERVGAQPDMVTFTPDGKTVLLANEGEPSDDYQVDPEGSISIVDVSDPGRLSVRTADFTAFDGQEDALRARGVRIYGPGASASKDFEPEYIAVSADGGAAWVTLQENNAFAKVDIATARVTDILPLGYKDHGALGNEFDASDDPKALDVRSWPGVTGMYLPDAIASFSADGRTFLVTANEGDARAWGEDNVDYWNGDASKGFVEEFRVKHLVHPSGFDRRAGDDLPPQLRALAEGALLDPSVFAYCGALAGDPGACRDDGQLGRLNISWTLGYQTNDDGSPKLYKADGTLPAAGETGTRLMYERLHSYGGRSLSIWNADGGLVWDSGADIEKFLASDECRLGRNRDIPCAAYFNSGHDEGDAFDSRSDAKGPEPEGVVVGSIGRKTFAFVGLERMGGVLVYDVTDPAAPVRIDYLNTREDWVTKDPETVLDAIGDLGPEGLVFIPAALSPNGQPLLVVGYEVSGTTAIYQIDLSY